MTLRPGTCAAFGNSLGEAIESAFAGELWALHGKVMPSTGKEDRELLFAAIGQGVLQYLARRNANVTVTVPWSLSQDTTIAVDLAVATLKRTSQELVGAGFEPGAAVTLRELGAGTVLATTAADSSGGFSLPLGGLGSKVAVDARDSAGNAAQAVLP
jgi:hypothetical protein